MLKPSAAAPEYPAEGIGSCVAAVNLQMPVAQQRDQQALVAVNVRVIFPVTVCQRGLPIISNLSQLMPDSGLKWTRR